LCDIPAIRKIAALTFISMTTEPAIAQRTTTVALVGNPNTGKTTLFNALTGFRRHTANYPGVTVDLARGPIQGATEPMELLDLPGTYSLAASSPDEAVVADVLSGIHTSLPRPDALLVILDASNLQRNCFLLSQLLELQLPTVVALNMTDIAAARGFEIDVAALSERLGVPVLAVQATKPDTTRPIVHALRAATELRPEANELSLPAVITQGVESLNAPEGFPRALITRALLYPESHAEQLYLQSGGSNSELQSARQRIQAAGIDGAMTEVQARYGWVGATLDGVLRRPEIQVGTWSDRMDQVLTHRIGGAVVLLAVLYGLFWSIFSGAGPLMDLVEGVVGSLGEFVAGVLPAGMIRSLIVDGVIAGAGGVIVFLPQIVILFLFVAILEDCGYLARAAYMMDRLMRGVGLSGRAFIPLLSSFACAIPAIMGTRTIADRRERFITIMIAPFMSCSARLPVYVIMIAAFVPATSYLGGWLGLQPLVMMGMYLVGVAAAILVAYAMRKTVLPGAGSNFMMELPAYKIPGVRVVAHRVWEAAREFLIRAGTLILLVNVIVWALAYFPRSEATRTAVETIAAEQGWDQERTANELEGAYLRDSYLGQAGQAIEPVLRPLEWDWRIGVGVIASFPAREVIVATMGTLFNLGAQQDEASESLQQALRTATWPDGKPLFTLPVAISIMVFFALCAQCGATLAVIYKETKSWIYPVASFCLMTGMAYVGAWLVIVVSHVS
jgi:ferrous iron transport protein B